jgi:hypothetical protein
MKLKFLPGDLRRAGRIVAASGEIIAEFGVDPEFLGIKLHIDENGTQKAEIVLDLVVGSPATIIDADEKAVRALPDALPAIEYDYDPDEGDFFYNDAFEEEEDEDIMEGLCACCAQELCLQCNQCHTPACEEETDPTDDCRPF